MANEATNTSAVSTTDSTAAPAKTNWMKVALGWLIALFILFVIFYVVGRGFKSGEKAA